jgi:hypothetical protein
MSLGPPQISAKDEPLRRQVGMAYRTAREAGKSHDGAFHAAMTVYLEARPEEKTPDRLGRRLMVGGFSPRCCLAYSRRG